jgi:hypothetical protein
VILACLLTPLVLVGLISLVALGVRSGDRPGEARILDISPRSTPRSCVVTLTNPGGNSIVCGMSLRRPRPRVRLEGGSYIATRSGRTDSELLATRQAQIGALAPGETRAFVVPAAAHLGRHVELVVVIGQADRLRAAHRLLALPGAERRSASDCLDRGPSRKRTSGVRA